MSLDIAPAASRRLLPLVLLLVVIPWLGMVLAVFGGVRGGIGEDSARLAEIAITLGLGLPVAGFIATETMAFLLASRLLRPTGLLVQVARDAAACDFRRVPPPGGADEPGRLAEALGRLIRHLARRRQDLDAMASEIAGQGLVAGGAARAARLLAEQAPPARLVAAEPDPAVAWLNPALHRLLCALASFVVVISAASLGSYGLAAVVACALLGGRLADPLRRVGPWALWLVLGAALGLWLLPEAMGPGLLPRSLAVALAASLALHGGSGWRGPCPGAAPGDGLADAAWQHAGLAGALAGGGVAAALIGMLGAPLADNLLPLPLLALAVLATPRGPGPAAAFRAGWPNATIALRLLRQLGARRRVFLEALPAGLLLGLAVALAAQDPYLAVGVAVLASLLAGVRGAVPSRCWLAVALLGAALGVLAFGQVAGAAALAVTGAILAWPFGAPAESCDAARQSMLLAMLARAIGVVLGLLGAAQWLAMGAG